MDASSRKVWAEKAMPIALYQDGDNAARRAAERQSAAVSRLCSANSDGVSTTRYHGDYRHQRQDRRRRLWNCGR